MSWTEHITGIKYKTVDPAILRDKDRKLFVRRRDAIMARLNGAALKDIESETGVVGPEVVRLLKRFKMKSDDGVCFGEIALIPRQRVKRYERKKPLSPKRSEQKGGMAGVLGMLLRSKPNIEAKFAQKVIGMDSPVSGGTKYQKNLMCQEFYKICETEGVTKDEWPFTQSRSANRTLCRYIDEILESDFVTGAVMLGGAVNLIHSTTGRGVEPLLTNFDVLDVLEIDSHYLDGIFVLNIKGDRRVTTEDVIDRFWLISARCRKSKAVFAARYVFSSEVTAMDVFQVICDAFLGTWRPQQKFSFPDLKYMPGAGMPAYIFSQLKYHCITAIYFDNAMQHYANDVKGLCLDVLGIAIDYGPLNLPSRRNTIEGLFKTISHRVLHTLASTTGSNPYDGRADNPVGAAVHYNINVDEALEVLDCYLANFNATPISGANKSNSPLQVIGSYLADTDRFIPSVPEVIVSTKGIGSVTKKCRVWGNMEKGVRPRVKLDKAIYTNVELSQSPHLVGQSVYIKINPSDYRYVTMYLESGVEFGELLVEAAWRDHKHSMQTRKLINRAHDKKAFTIMAGQAPVIAYRAHLMSKRSPANNRELQRLAAESGCDALPTDEQPSSPTVQSASGVSRDVTEDLRHDDSQPFHTNKRQEQKAPKWETMDEFKF
ncbi:hypothetical protein NLO95_20825 [Pseudomonas syringae]|nr:hypothetical protein [Pseudomonas syringae]